MVEKTESSLREIKTAAIARKTATDKVTKTSVTPGRQGSLSLQRIGGLQKASWTFFRFLPPGRKPAGREERFEHLGWNPESKKKIRRNHDGIAAPPLSRNDN